MIQLPDGSVFDCERNGTKLYFIRDTEEDTVIWFFVDADSKNIRVSTSSDEIGNFISNCILDKILTEEKALNDFWSCLSKRQRKELMIKASGLKNPSAVEFWRLPPEIVRVYLERNPDTMREMKREEDYNG